MIKCILYDLSEVIISGYWGTEKRIANLLNINQMEVVTAIKGKSFIELMKGKITEDEYIDKILEKYKWKISKQKFKEIIRKNHNKKS